MEEGKKKNSSKLLATIIAAVVAVVAIVTAIFIINANRKEEINEAYFHSTDKRIVYEPKNLNEDQLHGAKRVFEVYSIDGQTVTGYTVYYEFDDDYSAGKHATEIDDARSITNTFAGVKQYGKYVAAIFRDDDLYVWTTDSLRAFIKDRENPNNPEADNDPGDV